MRKILLLALVAATTLGADQVSPEVRKLVEGNNRFTLAMYQELAPSPGNLVVSPFNLSTTLSMAYVGARGNTATQMEQVLGYPGDTPEEVAKAWKELLGLLQTPALSKNVTLNLANSVWVDQRLPILFLYKSLLSRSYLGGGVREVSFTEPTLAADEINGWVSEATQGHIDKLLQPGILNERTRMVLVSALFLQAQWMTPFKVEKTVKEPFHVTSAQSVEAPMMHGVMRLPYIKERSYAVAAFPYRQEEKGPHLTMLVFLPDDRDGLSALEQQLSHQMIEDALLGMRVHRLGVALPKFRLATRLYARQFLERLGITDAFTSAANFSGITGRADLSVDAVVHEAFIQVDEEGTEAAAASAVVIGVTSVIVDQEPSMHFIADHPFLYFILDSRTGQILFTGRVADPVGES